MEKTTFADKRPWLFSLLLVLLLVIVQAAGVVTAQRRGLPSNTFGVYTEIVLVVILATITSRMKWWSKIGFGRVENPAILLLFLPALALVIGNLSFGIAVRQAPALLTFALLAITSGFVEEVVFRGLMLRAFLPRGPWKAVLVTAAIFGFTHLMNVFAGYEPLYAVIQVAYALAIGFCFGAMAVKGGVIWPLVITHALGNFFAFINNGQIGMQLYIVSLIYIVLFTGWGLYLMLRKERGFS
jgi:membrane protease YdiL (CAAX protease family)